MYNKNYKIDYVGDGVYALFDGYGIWLHTDHHEHPKNQIYIEPSVLKSLNNFAKRMEIESE